MNRSILSFLLILFFFRLIQSRTNKKQLAKSVGGSPEFRETKDIEINKIIGSLSILRFWEAVA